MIAMTNGPRKSAWVPWVFVGAMGVVVAVNAVMVTYALTSYSGLAVEKPYERGVHYNDVLAAQRGQDALGWRVSVNVEPGQLVLRLQDRDGQPLDRTGINARLERPVGKDKPLPLEFTAAGNGRFVAPLSTPYPGQWDVKAALRHGDDQYLLVRRIQVPQ